MVQLQTPPSTYLASLETFHSGVAAQSPAWLHRLRLEAAARFAALGFPTTKLEDWKYTNVAPIAEGAFEPAFGPAAAIPTGPFTFGAAWSHLVFVNGAYAPALSSVSDLPRGVRVESLASALSNGFAPVLERRLARYAPHESDSFTALNTAFLRDGAFVYVPDGKIAETPVQLLFITTGGEKRVASYPRVLAVLGRGAAATIVESYVSLGQGPSFTNAVTEIVASDGAIVQHYKLQFESRTSYFINTTRADLGGDAKLSSFALDLGGKLARSTLTARLQAPGGECTLDGLYLATDQQHVDNHTSIDHAASHTSSSQLYKGILAS
ncbi:MAG: SufD family Fe-S cluster assembly protein, partial [Chloroflexi bacterium]|nr:SufD family Fe-S cluster assembly protein [Chloroflexota bacterium]